MNKKQQIILGAIAGDVIASVYEFNNLKTNDLNSINLFNENCKATDDSILTFATLDAILHNKSFSDCYWEYGNKYDSNKDVSPGWGGMFRQWLKCENKQPYNSFGNGSAMRISPVALFAKSLDECLKMAKESAEVTHNHEEGVKGAQAIAGSIYLISNSYTKEYIKDWVERTFNYNLNFTLDEIRDNYKFNETCQGSVPQAIVAFLESESYEDAIRKVISIGGDSDTIACMTGGMAAAFYDQIPNDIIEFVINKLPQEFKDLLNELNYNETRIIIKPSKVNINIVNKSPNPTPKYAKQGDSGFDLRAWIGEEGLILKPLERQLIPTGIYVELIKGYEAQVRPRSGCAWNQGLSVCNSPGTIDVNYTGEIKVIAINLSNKSIKINNGDRIAQCVICPVLSEDYVELQEVNEISANEKRGETGFGSSGIK